MALLVRVQCQGVSCSDPRLPTPRQSTVPALTCGSDDHRIGTNTSAHGRPWCPAAPRRALVGQVHHVDRALAFRSSPEMQGRELGTAAKLILTGRLCQSAHELPGGVFFYWPRPGDSPIITQGGADQRHRLEVLSGS